MMCECVRAGARPHFFSSFSLKVQQPLLHRFKPYTSSAPSMTNPPPIKMSTQIVEHVVLFKVKPDTDPAKVTTMLDRLNALNSLDQLLYLTAGPVFRNRSSSSFNFTHMLHSRYRTKDDLDVYTAHPSHVSVVTESIRPIIDDIMAVDWVADDLTGPVVPKPGSAMRVTLLKLKEGGLGEKEKEKEKEEVLGVIGGIRECFGSIVQLSFGENFSPARAKGFSIGSIAILPGVNELEGLDSNVELVNSQKEKVRDLLESVIVLDYSIPLPSSSP